MSDLYDIWTDGAAEGNGRGGPGGWGVIIFHNGKQEEFSGGIPVSSCNISELTGAIKAMEAIPERAIATLHSDSKYVIRGITEWVTGWKRNGWLTKDRTPVKNRELWERLDALNSKRFVTWKWVKGHAGNALNERVDMLAVGAVQRAKFGAFPPETFAALENNA